MVKEMQTRAGRASCSPGGCKVVRGERRLGEDPPGGETLSCRWVLAIDRPWCLPAVHGEVKDAWPGEVMCGR